MATRKYTMTYKDYSNEESGASMNLLPSADATALGNLKSAVEAVSKGVLQKTTDSTIDRISNDLPSDVEAQREIAWFVSYEDTVTHLKGHFTIPCADFLNVELIANTDYADLTQTPMSTLVTQVEASVVSNAGNAVSVLAIYIVGRSN